jgi:hypothetical protein
MMRRKLPLGLLLLALGAPTSGCGKFREISLCRGLARDINAALDEIEALSKAKPIDEPRIAKRYAQLAKTLAPRAAGEQPLAVAVREYIAVLQATETAVKNHDAALKSQTGRSADSRRELERLVKRERAAATRIEAECHN